MDSESSNGTLIEVNKTGGHQVTPALLRPVQALAILVLACVAFFGAGRVAGYVRGIRDTGTDSAVEVLLRLPGSVLVLPLTDHFGQAVPSKGERTVLVLAGCNKCSMTPAGLPKVPLPAGDVILLAQDDSELSRLRKLSPPLGRCYVVLNRLRALAPRAAYDVAPLVLTINERNEVLGARRWY